MSKFGTVLGLLGRYKILLTIVLGVLFVGVLSDVSALKLIKLSATKSHLEDEVNLYRRQASEAKKELDALGNSPEAAEKVARERYFMKHADEDVFVLSTDVDKKDENNSYATE